MKKNDKVRVIQSESKYYGLVGTIDEPNVIGAPGLVRVIFDGLCMYSGRYIKKSDLKLESEENNMAKLEGFKKVAVVEQGTGCCKKDYYYALFDDDIHAGDTVLVSGKANGETYVVKEVVSVDDINVSKSITAEIICKVDMSAYNDRVGKRKQAEELRKRMIEKRKEIEARKDDDYYASLDPDYAAILEEMRGLGV